MTGIEEALGDVIGSLDRCGISYAISGSLAAAYHGYVRATEDIDIQVAIEDPDQLEDLAEQLPPNARRIDAWTWSFPGEILVELYETQDELDEASMARRVEGPLPGGKSGWFVDLEPLLVLKIREHVRHGHGHKHIADIEQLLARNHDTLDVDELERLLGLDPAWEAAWDELLEPA